MTNVSLRIAGAAKITIGSIISQARIRDWIQCRKNALVTWKLMLAIAVAIPAVKPD
jgi:hypothetical protein